jgi:hypothetical protein
MVLAVALIRNNDPGYKDWPMGLGTPPSENARTMSGVFGRIALICSLSHFADEIPDVYATAIPFPDTASTMDHVIGFFLHGTVLRIRLQTRIAVHSFRA